MKSAAQGPVGRRVRALRAYSGLTQAELAERSGVARETIGRIERGLGANHRTVEALDRALEAAGPGPTKRPEGSVQPMDDQREHILQFFAFEHLPPALQAISEPFCSLAHEIVEVLPRNPERTVALRKLLEAKDAAVRASIAKSGS